MHGECALTIITFLKFLGFVVGICFFQVEYNQDGIQNVYGAFFFMLTTATFSNMASVQFVSMSVEQERTKQVSNIVIYILHLEIYPTCRMEHFR